MPTTIHPTIHTLDDVRHRHDGHWFDPDTMHFHGSRVGGTLYARRFFVSSERSGFDYSSPRRYTVRVVMPDCGIDTAGEFLEHATGAAANRRAEQLSRALHAGRIAVRCDPYTNSDGVATGLASRRHYAWRPFVILANGLEVPIGTRNTWHASHALKRWLLAGVGRRAALRGL